MNPNPKNTPGVPEETTIHLPDNIHVLISFERGEVIVQSGRHHIIFKGAVVELTEQYTGREAATET